MNVYKRKTDILKLIKSLDITPSMHMNAVDKYKSVARYLQSHGIYCDIYPQGSFATGTAVRPIGRDNYDLDTVCELSVDKMDTSAKETKLSVGDVLLESERYKHAVEYDICWTLEYADINNYGFSLDIVPAVEEDANTKLSLIKKSFENKDLVSKSIAITKKTDETYRWATNNPKGYVEWFNRINEPFRDYNRAERRSIIFEQNKAIFESVDDIPETVERSSLQIAIQILKRHRDVYFSHKMDGKELRPISVIITTLATSIAENAPSYFDPFQLLEFITSELKVYAELGNVEQIRFTQKYSQRNLISRPKGKWSLINPVNPEDNLLDSWNENTDKATAFFKWLTTVINDFKVLSDENDEKFLAVVENAFGYDFVKRSTFFDGYKKNQHYSTNISIKPSKPWGKENG